MAVRHRWPVRRLIRLAAWVSVFASLLTYVIPGVLVPGRGYALMALVHLWALGCYLAFRQWPQHRLNIAVVVVFSADLMWLVTQWAFARPDLFSPPIVMCFAGIAAAVVLSWRAVVAKMAIASFMALVGRSLVFEGSVLWAAASVDISTVTTIIGCTYLIHQRITGLSQEVKKLSCKDPLTGVANRHYLDIADDFFVPSRWVTGKLAVVMIDLDHFKRINDEYGHMVGDEVLMGAAQALEKIVPDQAVLARLGGEEFLIAAKVTDDEAACEIAARAHRAVGELTRPVPVTCSVGVVASSVCEGSTAKEQLWYLIDCADQAMYEAKVTGRNRVVEAHPELREVSQTVAAATREVAPEECVRAEDAPASPTSTDPVISPDHTCPVRCGMNSQPADTMVSGRYIGWVNLACAFTVMYYQMMGFYLESFGHTVAIIMFCYYFSTGLTQFIFPRLAVKTSAYVIGGNAFVWVVVWQEVKGLHPTLISTPIFILPSLGIAAWWLSRRHFTSAVLLAFPLMFVATRNNQWPLSMMLAQTCIQGGIAVAVCVHMHWCRRRLNYLLAKVHILSMSDGLTGLANRRHLADHAQSVVAYARQHRQQVAVLMVDLDKFKRINDTFGHVVGDEVLRRVAVTLNQWRTGEGCVARTGGEEIIVLLPVPDSSVVEQLAEQVRFAIREQLCDVQVTCSIGVLTQPAPDAAVDPQTWLWSMVDHADRALYEAKKKGRDQVVCVSEVDQLPAPRRPIDRQPDQPLVKTSRQGVG